MEYFKCPYCTEEYEMKELIVVSNTTEDKQQCPVCGEYVQQFDSA